MTIIISNGDQFSLVRRRRFGSPNPKVIGQSRTLRIDSTPITVQVTAWANDHTITLVIPIGEIDRVIAELTAAKMKHAPSNEGGSE